MRQGAMALSAIELWLICLRMIFFAENRCSRFRIMRHETAA
jgi:hypothetical protein